MYKRLLICVLIPLSVLIALLLGGPALARVGDAAPTADPASVSAVMTDTRPFLEPNVWVMRTHTGTVAGEYFGWIAARLPDFNGDGADEYLVGAPFHRVNGIPAGRVEVYDGATGAVLTTTIGNSGNLLGYSASAAGDVNGDDTPDYIIAGQASYYFQSAGRVLVLSGADHTILHDLVGPAAFNFGSAVAGLGDVNNDGFDDIAVGAQSYSSTLGIAFPSPPDGTGRVYAYSGQDGSELWTVDGAEMGDFLGAGMGRMSDMDADGIDDLVVAARGANASNGEAYVLSGVDGKKLLTVTPTVPLSGSTTFGQFFARDAGDINADGTADIFIGDYFAQNGRGRVYAYSGVDGSPLHVLTGAAGDGLGPGRGIPDMNGDGHDDLIAASYTAGDTITQGGRIDIYSGADGSVLRTASGGVVSDTVGVDALPLGDINADGYPDYLVTAVGLDFMGLAPGRAYVISFKTTTYLPTITTP